MKTKLLISAFTLLMLLGFNADLLAQGGKGKKNDALEKGERVQKTKKFLNKTSKILKLAYAERQENKVNCGGCLKQAFEHQKIAIRIAKNPKKYKQPFKKAILHSWKARRLAFISLQKNGVEIDPKWTVKLNQVWPPLNKEKAQKLINNYHDLEKVEQKEKFEKDETAVKELETDIADEAIPEGSDEDIDPDELDEIK